MNIIFLIFFSVSLFLFLKNIFSLIFSLENYKLHKQRLKQLQFEGKKSNEEEIKQLIDKITEPVIKSVIPSLKIKNLAQIEKDLKMAQWDDKMNPYQYIALSLITKALGIVLFLVLFSVSKPMAFLWGILLFLSVSFLMNNSAKNRREALMLDFPDFIRITQGYLTSGMPFTQAVMESIKYVGEEWQPILEDFVVEAELSDIGKALDTLANGIDVFEVREFVSLVKLSESQGGDIKDGFEAQADKIQEMLYDVMMAKIEKRRVYGIMVQGPLLLCNIVVFGLPTIEAMLNMGTM